MTDEEEKLPEGVLEGIRDIMEGNTATLEELKEAMKEEKP